MWTIRNPKRCGQYLCAMQTLLDGYISYRVLYWANDLSKVSKVYFGDKKKIGGWYIFENLTYVEVKNVIGWQSFTKYHTRES